MVNKKWSIKILANAINATIRTDKDFFIAVSGQTGSGKSTAALWIAKKVNSNFKIKTGIVYSREELINAINTFPKFSVIICDEAITSLFKRDFMQREQKEMLRLFDVCRYRNLVVILCIPIFWSLDKHVLESKIKLRVHIDRTGFAILFKPMNHPHSPDPWARKQNLKVSPNWDANPDSRRMVGFIGWMTIPDMPKGWKKVYLKWQEIKKEEIGKKAEILEKESKAKTKKFADTIETYVLFSLVQLKLLTIGALKEYCAYKGIRYVTLKSRMDTMRKLTSENSDMNVTLKDPGKIDFDYVPVEDLKNEPKLNKIVI